MDMNEFIPPEETLGNKPSTSDVNTFDSAIAALPAPDAGKDEDDLIENDDGSVDVVLDKEAKEPKSSVFDENLADGVLDASYLSTLGSDMVDLIAADKQARKKRDEQYAEGIRRTGLGGEAPGGADFDGASEVVHPMLAKGCIDFASKAVKELFPANGPCKTQIIGESTEAKVDRAERKKTFMNWQLCTKVPENRSELEKLLSQVGLGGTQYKRWWWDATAKRPRTEVVYIDDVFLPFSASGYENAVRVTHRQWVTQAEFDARIESELYVDVPNESSPSGFQDRSKAETASDKVEGVEESFAAFDEDGEREVYLTYAQLAVEDDPESAGITAPYILHLCPATGKVLGMYRNWKEGDATFEAKAWMVDYNFLPWRGGQAIGLGHVIGSLSAAATGSLRAILDAAHIQNFPGAVKLKGGRTAGQSIQVNATEITEIDAPAGIDDIRKLMMPFPFNGPSAVLYNVLEFLTQQAEVVVATASEKIADGGSDMPMGTAMALIEGGSTNFSAIHARMHSSMKRELAIVHRLNAENLSDHEVVEDLGELVVSRKDFEGPMDIIPVSDPNIFSEAQRYAQLQAVLQLRQDPQFMGMFKPDRLLHRALKLLQVPDAEDIANLPKDPRRTNALEENYVVASAEPRPLKVYEDQDDVSHLLAHTHFMSSPVFGGSQLIGPQALPPLIQHCKDHLMAFYRKHTQGAADAMKAVAKARNIKMSEEEAEAHATAFADQTMVQALGPQIMPALDAAQKAMAAMQPPPQADPNTMHQEQSKQQIAAGNNTAMLQAKDKDLAYQAQRDAADRTVTQQAGQLGAMVEHMKDETTKNMENLRQVMENHRQQVNQQQENFRSAQEHAQDRLMAELTATNQENMAVLKELLSTMTAAQTTEPQVDFAAVLKPVVDSIAAINEDLTSQLKDTNSKIDLNHSAVQSSLKDTVGKIAVGQTSLLGKLIGRGKPDSSTTPSGE